MPPETQQHPQTKPKPPKPPPTATQIQKQHQTRPPPPPNNNQKTKTPKTPDQTIITNCPKGSQGVRGGVHLLRGVRGGVNLLYLQYVHYIHYLHYLHKNKTSPEEIERARWGFRNIHSPLDSKLNQKAQRLSDSLPVVGILGKFAFWPLVTPSWWSWAFFRYFTFWPLVTSNRDLGNSLDILLSDLRWPKMMILGLLEKLCFLTSGDLTWRSWEFLGNFLFDLWWPDMTLVSTKNNFKNCSYSMYKSFKRCLQFYLWWPQMTFDPPQNIIGFFIATLQIYKPNMKSVHLC